MNLSEDQIEAEGSGTTVVSPDSQPSHTDIRFFDYSQTRTAHWDAVHSKDTPHRGGRAYYHRKLLDTYRFAVNPGQRVLEIGCGTGDLLAALEPSVGVGIDFSVKSVEAATKAYPGLSFIHADGHTFELTETFDIIILSDLVNDVWDVQTVLNQVAKHATPRTRIILNFFSHLWRSPLSFVRNSGMATKLLPQNWLTTNDVTNLLDLANIEVVRKWDEILLPVDIPILSTIVNRYLVKLWPFRHGALTHFILARPQPVAVAEKLPSVSIIVAARNEAGNIEEIFARTPEFGSHCELIFVEGGSSDNTYEAIEATIAAHPERDVKLFRQPGTGKGDAVRVGFNEASGDVLMILDADMTVPPEELPRFYNALVENKGEFINGVRLIYPMDEKAMRFFNLVGNKFFSLAFSWLLEQPIKDTLCGTKVLRKTDYELIAANRKYFGDFDPFGDFDLIFGAVKQNLKIAEMPIRYGERTYGDTNISRWKHGVILLKMVVFAASRIKFV